MISFELVAAGILVGQHRGNQKGDLFADYLHALRMAGVKMVDMVSIVVPDIQDALRWNAHALVGKDLVGAYHLEQGNSSSSERKSRAQSFRVYSCYAHAFCRCQHVLRAGIHEGLDCRDVERV